MRSVLEKDRAILRRVAFTGDLQRRRIDFNRACASEVVVDAGVFTLFIQDATESSRILIRTGVCCRATLLLLGVVTTFFNGNRANLVIIFKVRSGRCPRDIRGTIGLGSRAVDIGIAFEDCERTILRCNVIAFFASQIMTLCSDKKVWTRIIAARFINVTIHTGLFCRSALARKRDFACIAILQVIFMERMRVFLFRNTVSAIASLKVSCCCCRILRYVSQITIRLRLVISFDRDCRLYLEDVLVRIFRLSVRIETAAALRAGVPAGSRLAVEVLAEIVAVWRCGVDFPVAARASRDGILCLCCIRRVMEGTICTACIDDDSIVFRRLGNQRAVVRRAVIVNGNITRLALADELDLISSRDAVNQDIAVRGDVYMPFVCCDAIADCDTVARNVNVVVDIDDTRESCPRLVRAAADIDSASIRDVKVTQRNGMTDVAFQVNTAAIAVDDKAGMRQVLFLNKTFRRASGRLNIIPIRGKAKAYRYIWTRVIWFFGGFTCNIRFTVVPVGVIVFRRRAIILSKFGAFDAIGIRNQSFRSSNPIVSISIRTIYRTIRISTTSTTDKERIFLALARQRILQRRRNSCQIGIACLCATFCTPLGQYLSKIPVVSYIVPSYLFSCSGA